MARVKCRQEAMIDTTENLILDLIEWVGRRVGALASPWKTALHFEDPPHTTMPKIHRLAIHHRTASDQTIYVMPLALSYGLLGYAPLPEGSVHPYVADSKVRAFPDDFRGHGWVSHYHHGFNRFGD